MQSTWGDGNLKHRIEITSKDEFGDLTTAFNNMTENLEKTTTSRDQLDKEITERKRSEIALRESEEKLSTLFAAMTEKVVQDQGNWMETR